MAHIHTVQDTDIHFKIDGTTRTVKNVPETKIMLVQHDHNSERFTFEIPRMVDGHDMSTCNVVQVHYINIDSVNKNNRSVGVYEIDDLTVSQDNNDVVVCSWLISENATRYVGKLSFVIRFVCSTDGNVDYAWNTAIHSSVNVASGIYNGEEVATEYADILEQWREELFNGSGGGVNEEAVAAIIETKENSVRAYGATGDGVADDTDAFQKALNENRTVFVPGGTYKLSKTLVIRENCGLELTQDTILQFTQSSGNCIEMRGSAVLRGNHGNLSVPYGFAGNAISMDTALDGVPHNSIPPYGKSCPMWKRQRFIYDVNIVMKNPEGFHRMQHKSTAKCTGTGLYMSADGTASIGWMWGIVVNGLRIAGGFSYGIRAINFDDPNDSEEDDAWNHDMRIEAVIEGCEVGVSLENCNNAHLDVTVQPNTTVPPDNSGETGIPYAKWGIRLEDAKYIDLSRACVWDWNAKNSLWASGNQYQHIAMYGNCKGLVLGDFVYHATSADIRSLIYTDTPSNLEKMTILQEPITRWFKPVNNEPYFFDGTRDRALMLKTDKFSAEQAEFIRSADGYYTKTEDFTNLVEGYTEGVYLVDNGTTSISGYVTTDFIPIDGAASHTYRIGGEGIIWNDDWQYCRIGWYDSSKKQKGSVMSWNKIGSSIYYPVAVEDDAVAAAFSTNANVAPPNGAAFFRITAKGKGANLIVTIDEKQEYSSVWHGQPKRLDESIYAQHVFLVSSNGTGYSLTVNNDGTLGTKPME